MIQLLIPSIGLAAYVQTGSLSLWNEHRWREFEEEAQIIMEENVYKYPHNDVLAAHDTMQFSDLDEVKKNTLIIYNNTRYRVDAIFTVPAEKVYVLNMDGLTLHTCVGISHRLIVHAK